MMAVPWWHAGSWAAALFCVGAAALLGWAAVGVTRAHAERCFALIAITTTAVLVGDAVRGGTLELDAPFGNSPTVAGRFDGIGNIAFGFSMGALLVVCALALHWNRRRAMPWVIAACAAYALAGAPPLADKVGLVPVWIPAAGVLLLSASTGRIRWRVLAVLGVCALAMLGAFALYDLGRTAGSQSHLARFLTSGDIGNTITRKATSMLRSFRGDPWRWVIPLPLIAILRERRHINATPWLRSLALALATAGVLGSVLEDSGIVVGAAVLVVSWVALSWLASAQAVPSAVEDEGAGSASGSSTTVSITVANDSVRSGAVPADAVPGGSGS
jgi:hypothetical protein